MTALLDRLTDVPTSSQRSRRVLLIAYCFPPVGGAGVQRPVKWVKYLSRAGWDVTVLTPSNPSVPVLDASLLREIPDETRIVRTPTWEPGYAIKRGIAASTGPRQFWKAPLRWTRRLAGTVAKACLQPDPQILWYPNAVRAATRLLSAVHHDAIVCTAPPYTSFLVGRALKRRFGIPLVLDYRDEWDLSSQYLEHAHRDLLSRMIQERQQRSVLQTADAVVATTQASVQRLGERLRDLGHSARQMCIYNGFDAEDFRDWHSPSERNDRFRLVYTGTLWNLTDVAPVVAAVEQLQQSAPELAERLEFVCVGRKTDQQLQVLSRLNGTGCRLTCLDYCEHARVLEWLQSADALCLLLSDVPGAERVVPAKLFEYLATRKDLLAISPDGETASIVRRFHPQGHFLPADVTGIRTWLADQLMTSERREIPHFAGIDEYSREAQTDRLVDLLESLTASSRRTGG